MKFQGRIIANPIEKAKIKLKSHRKPILALTCAVRPRQRKNRLRFGFVSGLFGFVFIRRRLEA
jgi:hypothetical protein